MIVLSKYLEENGFKLKSIKIKWRSVEDDGRVIKKAGFYARVTAFDEIEKKSVSCFIEPTFFTEDMIMRLGYECDELFLSEDPNRFPGFVIMTWDYARYGETVVRSGGIRNESTDMPPINSRFKHLFYYSTK